MTRQWTLTDMLLKSNNTTIFVKNIQKYIIEFRKYLHNVSVSIIKEVFTERVPRYNLQGSRINILSDCKTEKYGTDTIVSQAVRL